MIASYTEDDSLRPLDADGEEFDERCLEACIWSDKYPDYMIPFYEFDIQEAGRGASVHRLEELVNGKPAIRQ